MIKYIVKAKIIKGKIEEQYIFECFDKVFENQQPILARNEAFEYYTDLLNMIKNSSNDEQDFISKMSDTETYYEFEEFHIRLRYYKESGLALYVHLNEDELLLHADGDFNIDMWDSISLNLVEEYEFYIENKYDYQNQAIKLVYYNKGDWEDGYTEDEPGTYNIIKTPADWTGKDLELWWGKEAKNKLVGIIPQTYTIKDVIALGEGKNIEFKSALVYNFKTQRGGIGVKYIIAKAICSFLNTNGGYLIIGVSDDKKTIGLEPDFSLSQGKDPHDFFLLEFDELINRFFSSTIHGKIKTQFYFIDDKDVFVVQINKSDSPIFLKSQQEKEFWIRGEASTRRLIEVEEIIQHCFHTWLKKD